MTKLYRPRRPSAEKRALAYTVVVLSKKSPLGPIRPLERRASTDPGPNASAWACQLTRKRYGEALIPTILEANDGRPLAHRQKRQRTGNGRADDSIEQPKFAEAQEEDVIKVHQPLEVLSPLLDTTSAGPELSTDSDDDSTSTSVPLPSSLWTKSEPPDFDNTKNYDLQAPSKASPYILQPTKEARINSLKTRIRAALASWPTDCARDEHQLFEEVVDGLEPERELLVRQYRKAAEDAGFPVCFCRNEVVDDGYDSSIYGEDDSEDEDGDGDVLDIREGIRKSAAAVKVFQLQVKEVRYTILRNLPVQPSESQMASEDILPSIEEADVESIRVQVWREWVLRVLCSRDKELRKRWLEKEYRENSTRGEARKILRKACATRSV